MNMNTTFLHDIFRGVMRQAQLVCMRLDPAQCDLHALLENVAKFSCQLHAATPGHVRNLDEKYATVAARAVGHEASHDSWATISCQQVLRGTLRKTPRLLVFPLDNKVRREKEGPENECSGHTWSSLRSPHHTFLFRGSLLCLVRTAEACSSLRARRL
jgi:hypothetical protein